MIPLWKEKEIREAIKRNPNLPDRELAIMFSVRRPTIERIKEAPAVRPRPVPKPKDELATPKRCPECGVKLNIWPCVACRPWAYYYDDVSLEEGT